MSPYVRSCRRKLGELAKASWNGRSGLLDKQTLISGAMTIDLNKSANAAKSPSYSSSPSMNKHIFRGIVVCAIRILKASISFGSEGTKSFSKISPRTDSEYFCAHSQGKTTGISSDRVSKILYKRDRKSPS